MSNINPTRPYVSNVDVVTTIRALIAKGQACGNILFAGDSNTGLPAGYASGAVEYYVPNGSATIYLKFSMDKVRFDGFVSRSATTPTWVENAEKDDIPTRYGGTGIVIPAGKSCKIYTGMTGVFTALVCVQGTTGEGFGSFIISGYGDQGGTSRYRVQDLNISGTGSEITCTVDGTSFIIKNGTGGSTYLVIEEFFNQGKFTHSII